MKKLKYLAIVIAFIFLSPTIIFLTGCGATPINDVKAVYFDTDIYEEGVAVFELDLKKPTILKCKVNPSGWHGKLVYNAIDSSPSNANNFDLDAHSGQFTIKNEYFQTVKIQVLINIDIAGSVKTVEDVCFVKRKVYPSQIFFSKDRDTEKTVYINSLGAHSLHIYGNFGNGNIEEISESEYNFEITSSDTSAISIPDSSRLKIYSLKSKIEAVDIDIKMLDTFGEFKGEKYELKLHVIVVLPTSLSVATFEGYDEFIYDGDNIDITIDNSFDSAEIGNSQYYNLKFEIELFSSSGLSNKVYIDSKEYTVTCTSNQETYRIIDNENGIFKVRKPRNLKEEECLPIDVTIATSANNDQKHVYKMSFTINFHFDI